MEEFDQLAAPGYPVFLGSEFVQPAEVASLFRTKDQLIKDFLGGPNGLDHANALTGKSGIDITPTVSIGGRHNRPRNHALIGHGQRLYVLS